MSLGKLFNIIKIIKLLIFINMKAIFKYFKELDFISRSYSFEYNDSTIYKTHSGAFFSLITFITAFVIAMMFGREIYERKLPNVNTSLENIEDSVIYLNKFPIIFSLYNNVGKMMDNLFDYLDVDVDFIIYDEIGGPTLAHNYSLILNDNNTYFSEFNEITQEYLKDNKGKSLYLLNFTEYDKIRNLMGGSNSSTIRFQFKFCDLADESRNCKADEEFINSIPFVMVRHVDFNIDSLNYKSPLNPYLKASFYSLAKNTQKIIYKFFLNSYYKSDNGWIFEEIEITHFYFLRYIEYDINIYDSKSNIRNCLNVLFSTEKIQNNVLRNYMKVQELFAKVGGIANAVFIIVRILSYHYLRFIYLSFIRRNSYLEMLDETKKVLNYNAKDNNVNYNINKTVKINCSKFLNSNIPSQVKVIDNDSIIDANNNINSNKSNSIKIYNSKFNSPIKDRKDIYGNKSSFESNMDHSEINPNNSIRKNEYYYTPNNDNIQRISNLPIIEVRNKNNNSNDIIESNTKNRFCRENANDANLVTIDKNLNQAKRSLEFKDEILSINSKTINNNLEKKVYDREPYLKDKNTFSPDKNYLNLGDCQRSSLFNSGYGFNQKNQLNILNKLNDKDNIIDKGKYKDKEDIRLGEKPNELNNNRNNLKYNEFINHNVIDDQKIANNINLIKPELNSYINISSKNRIHSLINNKSKVYEVEEKDLNYFKYILSYICCFCYDKNIKKIYNIELQKVKDLLDIRLFKLFLVKSYYEKFKLSIS